MLHCANCARPGRRSGGSVLSVRSVLSRIVGEVAAQAAKLTLTASIAVHRLGFLRDRSWWLTMLGIGVAFGVLLLGSIALFGSRTDAWNQAEHSATNLLLALDRDIERNLTVLDLSLQGISEALAEPGIESVSPSIRQHALFDRSGTAENLGSMLVIGPDGHVHADSTTLTPDGLFLGDRDYFQIHERLPDVGLYISRVFASRMGHGDLRFAITRRLDKPNGDFAGVVSASLRLTYFHRLFEKLDIGKKGSISLLRSDGRILYRYPFRNEDVDVDLSKRGTNFARFSSADSGQYVSMAVLDGVERLYTFRHLGKMPLILSVSLSTEEILEPWRRKTMIIGPAMLLLCASAVASSLLFRREMLRRARSERDLATANEQLLVQASTDGLTGLSNRRAFDAEFDRAFRTTVRQGSTITLLMIDADHFKRFNDTYGHVAGDEVLRAIGICMQTNLRRPGDRAARYGGEEFAAILPETDQEAALRLGESIRMAVKRLEIAHAGSKGGSVSISIGAATTTPLIGDQPASLLEAADQSLYAAKKAGRDCVRCAPDRQQSKIDLSKMVSAAIRLHDAERANQT